MFQFYCNSILLQENKASSVTSTGHVDENEHDQEDDPAVASTQTPPDELAGPCEGRGARLAILSGLSAATLTAVGSGPGSGPGSKSGSGMAPSALPEGLLWQQPGLVWLKGASFRWQSEESEEEQQRDKSLDFSSKKVHSVYVYRGQGSRRGLLFSGVSGVKERAFIFWGVRGQGEGGLHTLGSYFLRSVQSAGKAER